MPSYSRPFGCALCVAVTASKRVVRAKLAGTHIPWEAVFLDKDMMSDGGPVFPWILSTEPRWIAYRYLPFTSRLNEANPYQQPLSAKRARGVEHVHPCRSCKSKQTRLLKLRTNGIYSPMKTKPNQTPQTPKTEFTIPSLLPLRPPRVHLHASQAARTDRRYLHPDQ